MAKGTHFKNPTIETSRTAGRSVNYWVPPNACLYEIETASKVDTRGALGKYYIERAASTGAESDYIIIPLNGAGWMDPATPETDKGEIIRGFLPTSVDFLYGVGVADATSITADLVKTTYGNGAAPTVDSDDTISVTTAATLTNHATNRYKAQYALTLSPTPTAGQTHLHMTIVLQATGTFQFIGANVFGTLLS